MPITDPNSGTLDIEISVDTSEFQKTVLESILTKEIAQHVLWHFGDRHLGVQSGTFTERLMLTIAGADSKNRELLAKAFPAHVAAFRAGANEVWGIEFLRDYVRGD